MTGYIMIIAFAIIFFAVSTLVSRKYADDGVDDFVAAGRSVPFGLITPWQIHSSKTDRSALK